MSKKELKKKGETPQNPHILLKEYLEENYDLRFNILLKEVVDKNTGLSVDAADIWDQLASDGHKYSIGYINSMLSVRKHAPEFNPIQEYFKSLPDWDGVDHVGNVLSMIKLNSDQNQDLFVHHHRKFLMRCVNTPMGFGQNKESPLWISKQNSGKTTAQGLIVPDALSMYTKTYFPGAEILKADMFKYFNLIVEEHRKVGPAGTAVLKATMSTGEETLKVDGMNRRMHRTAAIWFNSNFERVLTDPTGNSRFQPWMIERCNLPALKKYDKDKLWSQIYHEWNIYHDAEDLDAYLVTPEENIVLDKIRERHLVISREKSLILEFIEPCEKDAPGAQHLSAADIAEIFEKEMKVKVAPTTLGKQLKELGFKNSQQYKSSCQLSLMGYVVRFVDHNKN